MILWLSIILGTVALDQLSKYLTILYLKPVGSVPIIQDVLHLTYVENTGAAFGILKDARWVFLVISTVSIVAVLAILAFKRPQNKWLCLALALIVGGGIGNMIDRTVLGYVVDMIDFCLIDFAVFNVADSFVCVGAGLMVLILILDVIKEEKAERQKRLAEGVADQVPADEILTDEAPADEAPTDEAPADEAPINEMPTDEVPADETPADEVPADEVPIDEAPADEAPIDEVSDHD